MKFANFKWLEYAPSGFHNRNQVLTANDLWNRLSTNNWGENPALQDWYVSINRFDESFRRYRDTHLNKHGNPSVEDYEGVHITDRAVLEIDHPEMIQGSIKFSQDIISCLANEHGIDPETELVKDASGNKGFHFEIPAGLFLPEPHLKLFKIHRLFVESLFPKDWVRPGTMIDASSYQINRLLRLRGTRNKEFGFKVSLNGSFAELKTAPEKIYEFWKTPTKECVAKEFITGEWYWNFAPKLHLVGLWAKAQDQVENEGKTRVFIPASQRGKFKNAKVEAMPACIKAIHERMSENVRGDGLFNNSVCALTLFYLYHGYTAEAAKRVVRGLCSPTTKTKDELDEIEKSMDSMIDSDGQPKYPWTCGKDSFPHLSQFCANGNVKECPQACEQVEKTHARITGVGQAMDMKVAGLREGLDPYTFGIGPLDEFIGFMRPGKSIIIQAVPTVGKTAFTERILKHQAKIAKSRDELLLWIPPEDDAEETAEQLMMQQGHMNIEQLIHKAKNGGFGTTGNWFRDYNDTIKIWDVQDFSVAEIETAIKASEETFKKKVAVLYYDGVSFLKASNANRIGEAGVAQDIARLIKLKKIRGLFSVHPPKTSDDEKNDKRAVNKRLGLYGAYGSMFFAALGRTVISLWKEDDYTLMVGVEKAKDRLKGEVKMIEPFRMVFDRYFNVWEKEEALAMSVSDFGQDPAKSFIKRPKEFV